MNLKNIPPFHKKNIRVIIETPRGSRNKYAYDPELDIIVFKSALPEGHTFPFDFGFIPQTEAPDGDPVDVVVIHDSATVSGCMIECRVIGAFTAIEKKDGKEKIRNDRVLAVPKDCQTYSDLCSIKDMNSYMLEQLEHFFKSYNHEHGKKFKPLATLGPAKTMQLIKKHLVK
jgi:inorganic pyrophosphatase